jgi:hypothetical protein
MSDTYIPLKHRMLIASVLSTIGLLLFMMFFAHSKTITLFSLYGWVTGAFGWQLVDHFIFYLRHRNDPNHGK